MREFEDSEYQTVKSWSWPRQAVGTAVVTGQGQNPRFVVTNMSARGFSGETDKTRFSPALLYEELYCGRGEMENTLRQQVLDLRADFPK